MRISVWGSQEPAPYAVEGDGVSHVVSGGEG